MEQLDLSPLKEYLAILIAYIIKGKEDRRIAPFQATIQEIQQLANDNVKAALNDMVKEGALTFSRNINGVSFEFAPSK